MVGIAAEAIECSSGASYTSSPANAHGGAASSDGAARARFRIEDEAIGLKQRLVAI